MSTSGDPAHPGDPAAAALAVSVKLPEFWRSAPVAWFAAVEAQFDVKHITVDQTKYNYVLAALGMDAAAQVTALIRSPPSSGKYEALKAELLAIYEPPPAKKHHLLLNLDGLGDRKPSELIRYMRDLYEGDADPAGLLFRALFLQQLPADVRAILAGQDFSSRKELGARADSIMLERESHATAAVAQASRTSTTRSTAHTTQPTGTARDPPRVCYYHTRFGPNARNCRLPCAWAGNAPASH